ncbi:MAG TPA: SDR family NAD(P)-dependent oxidoreductase [Ferruginibacter sp.]|nr:SDR family NAD(P)-dependent oxidoreductase [Ferruginibacter sp.]
MKKIAVITGANGNLGKSVAEKFIKEGYFVIGIVHHKTLQPVFSNTDYEEWELDLLQEEKCNEAILLIIKKYEKIDVAVLTAGGFAMGDIGETSSSAIFKQYQLNFETAYHIARPVFLQMIHQNTGPLFLIGSRAGSNFAHAKGVTAYALSKSLLFRLSELMNIEAKGKNVVSAVVVPGIIDTAQNRKEMPNADFTTWISPMQIASIIYFYASETAAAIREPIIKIYQHS